MIYMATFCSKRESREKNNCRLSEEFQETRPMKLLGNFRLIGQHVCAWLSPGTRGDAGGSTRRPVERGGNCVERNRQRAGEGRERSRGESPASQGPRETIIARRSTKARFRVLTRSGWSFPSPREWFSAHGQGAWPPRGRPRMGD